MKLPPPAKKTIDLEGKLIKDGVRKAICDRQNALHELVIAINQYRKLSEQAVDASGLRICTRGPGVEQGDRPR
jgi:hypothetical protein